MLVAREASISGAPLPLWVAAVKAPAYRMRILMCSEEIQQLQAAPFISIMIVSAIKRAFDSDTNSCIPLLPVRCTWVELL
jgi:hypothetical protein